MRVLCVCVHFHKIMIVFGSFASQTYLCMYSFDLGAQLVSDKLSHVDSESLLRALLIQALGEYSEEQRVSLAMTTKGAKAWSRRRGVLA